MTLPPFPATLAALARISAPHAPADWTAHVIATAQKDQAK